VNYREAIAYVIERSGYDRGFVANPFDAEAVGLRRTEDLLERLERPDRRYPSVHIAGSKGKGSTAAMLESVLRAAGYRTGLYTTPHLHTFRERIQIDGQPITEQDFADLTAEIQPLNQRLADEHPEWGEATAFEVSTALAFLAFERAGVEIGVIEVGLGGRLDATNVIDPVVSVISSISHDHVSILGDTLGAIAFEKAGIIKQGRPVISASQQADAAEVLRRIADERGCRLMMGGQEWQVTGTTRDFSVTSPLGTESNLQVGLAGQHQVENAGLAVVTLQELRVQGIAVSHEALLEGLKIVRWPGRFEVAHRQPTVVVDGAHNVDSARRLVETLNEEYPGHKVTLVLGIARDKDIPGMLAHLVPISSHVIATASRSPRAARPEQLIEAIRAVRSDVPTSTARNVAEALSRAMPGTGDKELICVTGSLYAVAEAREALGLAETADFEQELLYR
jgi:dihydrofolate synthase / folylpolyglutamate synthase